MTYEEYKRMLLDDLKRKAKDTKDVIRLQYLEERYM